MKRIIFAAACVCNIGSINVYATDWEFDLEGGAVWFSKNDVRIPGDTGTKFDMLDLTGAGPDPYVRLYAKYNFNERHSLRLNLAPLEVSGTGTLAQDTDFKGHLFSSDRPATGTYKFNTYRLTYRWNFYLGEQWDWGLGGALLVRDAEIALEQDGIKKRSTDLGFVPLFHLYGAYSWNEQWSAIFDFEGAAGGPGRA